MDRAYLGGDVEGFAASEAPSKKWVEPLTGYAVEYGINTFVFWPKGRMEEHERQAELLAAEVAPAVHGAVRRERAGEGNEREGWL